VSDYKAIGYTEWEWIVARAGELYDRQRKSKRGIGGQGIFREDGHEYWYAVAAQERIAAALNAQAGVVEAARRYYEGWCQDEASDEPEDGSDRCRWTGCTVEQRDAARDLRDALASIKGVKP
jgi:hypothetical protein